MIANFSRRKVLKSLRTKLITQFGAALAVILPPLLFAEATIAQSSTICGIGAPSGFVAVGYQYSSNCRLSSFSTSFDPNATIIATPTSGLTKCGIGAPPGFIAVSYTYSSNCRLSSFSTSFSPNATVISSL